MNENTHRPSLLEILLIIGLIGLVGAFSAIAVNAARSRQRDATRLTNVRQIQLALQQHFNERNAYPPGEQLPLGDSAVSGCLSTQGFAGSCQGDNEVIMRTVLGTLATGLEGLVVCGTPSRSAFCYTATQDGSRYGIEFELERPLAEVGLVKGINCATQDGMAAGRCQ